MAEAFTFGGRVKLPGRRRVCRGRCGAVLWACAALAVWAVSCLGQDAYGPASTAREPPPAAVAVEGAVRLEVLTFRTASSYLEDSPLVTVDDIAVVFVAAEQFSQWRSDYVGAPYGDTAEDSALGPWKVKATNEEDRRLHRSWWNPAPGTLSRNQARTNEHGQAIAYIPVGDYQACVDHLISHHAWLIVGCGAVEISHGSVVYVFFDQGRAVIDTGDGPASNAYRRLDCRQQRRLGQTPDDTVAYGIHRGRCPSR